MIYAGCVRFMEKEGQEWGVKIYSNGLDDLFLEDFFLILAFPGWAPG